MAKVQSWKFRSSSTIFLWTFVFRNLYDAIYYGRTIDRTRWLDLIFDWLDKSCLFWMSIRRWLWTYQFFLVSQFEEFEFFIYFFGILSFLCLIAKTKHQVGLTWIHRNVRFRYLADICTKFNILWRTGRWLFYLLA